MIKKSVFEEELIAGMHQELIKNATSRDLDNVEKAVDYLNSAIDIFEDAGMSAQAVQLLNILNKIAEDQNDARKKSRDPRKISDPHIKGLTPEKQIENLKHHGTVFNMADDNGADDLLNIEVGDNALEVSEKDLKPETDNFEDERD